jgi:hypothetical protein
VIDELQCQREFEAKGAVPNYQPPLWRDGMPELDESTGLADAADRVNLHGLWAWVRGGGWRGPYVNQQTETWIDANVVAVPQLAKDPEADVRKMADAWIEQRLEVTDPEAAEAIRGVLEHSTRVALQTFYIGPYARERREPWYPSADFIQDDQIDAEALWALLRRLPDNVLNDVAAEKAAAQQQLAADRQSLHRVADRLDGSARHTLPLSLEYAEKLVQTLRHLVEGMIAYRRWLRRPDASLAQAAEQSMRASQSSWVHHTQRIAARGGPSAFVSDNLWDFTQQVIDRLNE